jgi:hypothetical protein
MPEDRKPVTFRQYVGKVVRRTFYPFSWTIDLLVATTIAAVSLYLQFKMNLITDWAEHWKKWVLSCLVPYAAVLLLHIAYRFIQAPWRIHQELDAEDRTTQNALTTKLTAAEQRSALLDEHLRKRNFPDNRPRITFDRWGNQEGPGGVLRHEAGLYLTNHGETALELILDDFTLGPDKWVGEKLSTIESKQKGFMKVERTTFVYGNAQRWDLLDGFKAAKKQEQRIHLRYRDFNNNWYRSTALLKCAPNFGGIKVEATTQEPLGSS